ncbi:MAG: discoidin domain-containing protein [Clostridiaceae bacterium]|nr:discoidin domain-containing protein [Clostridiaceae bacterium]
MSNLSKRLLSVAVSSTVLLSTIPVQTVFAVDKSKTVFAMGNAHIDAAWNWRYAETIQEVKTTFTRALDLMDANPNYHFSQSASLYYEWAKEYYPELLPRIEAKIKNGQWEIVGGQVIEPDLNSPSGESLVRQSLYAQKYFQKNFNVTPKVGWVPDVFGFNYNMPQILKKSGMDYFLTTKLNWNDTNKFPYEVFNWQGADGSKVLTYKPTNDYSVDGSSLNSSNFNNMMAKPTALGLDYAMTLYGSGDHGGGPVPADINNINSVNTDSNAPKVVMGNAIDAFKTIEQNVMDKGVTLPKVDDELYLEKHRGTATSAAPMKKYNRISEIKAEEAEKLSSIATILGVAYYPAQKINAAWAKTNLNQFHDVLPGSSITPVYDDAFNDAEIALNELNNSLSNATKGIDSRINTVGVGTPILLQNTLSWDRTSVAQSIVNVSGPDKVVGIFDKDDKEVPSQIVDRIGNKLTVVYEGKVPAMGYAVYRAVEKTNPLATTNLVVDKTNKTMENQYLKVVIDGVTGNIASIHDKINDKEVFEKEKQGNVLQVLEDTPKEWDAWDVDGDDMKAKPIELNSATSVELMESGPLKATYRIKKTYGTSPITQDITLYANSNKVDVKLSTEWNETQKMLKAAFPMSVSNTNATYEIAYAAIDRTTDINSSKFEVNGHKWADLTAIDKSYGISILNDCKYGWNTFGNVMRLTLIKSAADRGGNKDRGHQEMSYSILPHAGDWKAADTVLKGYEFNYPLLSQTTTTHTGDLANNSSFAKVTSSNNNVIMTVLKKAEDSEDYIVRMYESEGKDGSTATVSLPATVTDATEVNLIEAPITNAAKPEISGKTFTTTLNKYEIKTFLVKLNNTSIFKDQKPKTTTVDLTSSYNVDGISSDAKRSDGDFTGSGETFSAELVPDKVVSEGVTFNLGPKADGKSNFVKASGQDITLSKDQHKLLYILGAATPGLNSGDIKVNYTDNTSTTKSFTFTGWKDPIGNDLKTNVKETIGLNLSHTHTPNGNTYDVDNNLFVYKMLLDPSKTVASVTLPKTEGMKIAGMSFVDGISVDNMDIQSPTAVKNLVITTPNKYYSPYVNLSWDNATDNVGVVDYIIYRATKEDLSDLTVIGRSETNNYKDTNVNSISKFYYIVKAEDAEGNVGPASEVKNTYAGANIAMGKATTADSFVNSGEASQMAVDGDITTKWCANTTDIHWLMVDLGKIKKIDGFKIFHAAAGGEDAAWNTKAYTISVSDDNKTWTTPVTVTDNIKAITEDLVKTSGRYVKFNATKPTNSTNTATRIYEFQVYGDDADFPLTVPTTAPVIKSILQKNLTAMVDFDKTDDADGYVLKYGTEPGKYNKTITNLQGGPVTIDPVAVGNTYYFTVVPLNLIGQGPSSEEKSIKILNPTLKNVNMSSFYNLDGIASLAGNLSDGNFDGGGGNFDADVMPQTFNVQNFSFTLGSMKDGDKNVFQCDGSSIDLPQEKTTDLYLLETATQGNQTGNFTVNYADGTSETKSITMTDWCNSTVAAPESVALKMDHRIYGGQSQNKGVNLYLNSIKVDGTKAIKSLTVPNNKNMKIFALTLMSYVEPTASIIAAGITSVSTPAANATKLTLPAVPQGFNISIKSSDNTKVIGTDGTITPPQNDTTVALVFTVTKTNDSTTGDTNSINVLVPGKVSSLSSDATLNNITIGGRTLGIFVANNTEYNVNLPVGMTKAPKVEAIATNSNSKIVITQADSPNGLATIEVTAEDGKTKLTYSVRFQVENNSDAALKSITVDGTPVNIVKDQLQYTVNLPYTTKVPVVAVLTNDLYAEVVVKQANSSSGTASIKVTATDKKTVKTYSVTFKLASNTDATLSKITVNGKSLDGFDPNTTDYTDILPSGSNKVPVIAGTPTDNRGKNGAKIEIKQADLANLTAKITVTAADGKSTKTYNVKFGVADSKDATLKAITVGGNYITGFTADKLEYNYELPYKTTSIPQVIGITSDGKATVKVTVVKDKAVKGAGIATMVVTSADKKNTKTYTVKFTVSNMNTDATLSKITVGGKSIAGFKATNFNYTVLVPFGTSIKDLPKVEGIMSDVKNAKLDVKPAASVPGSTTIIVTAEDGKTTNTYSVNFEIVKNDATLDSISLNINGTKSDIAIVKGALNYTVNVPAGTTKVPDIIVTTTDPDARAIITPAKTLTGTTTVKVTSEDGKTTKTYTFKFKVLASGLSSSYENILVIEE